MFKELNNMKVFLEDPQKEVSVREFARLQKLAPATASTYLRKFRDCQFLKERKEHNLLLYKAAQDSEVYRLVKRFWNILTIERSGLLKYIQEEINPLAIFLFGSYAKGENQKGSDIDIFVAVHSKKEINLSKYEKILETEIQLFVHTPKEIQKLKKENPHLINNILNGVILYGFWEVV